MEASAVAQASRRGLIGRRSPILRLQKDDRLVALIRDGHPCAFEVLFDRYQVRLLAFCRNMLGSEQDAEDVLQEVFVAAHRAMLADERYINVRPWLYRIARNRSLNHLRKPTADGQDTMDEHVHANGTTTAEHVQHREELREVLRDVRHLPETQRTALLLREADGLSYNEIAQAMGTTVPAVKSLLVRARIALAEASQARLLTCGEVRLTLAEAAEGLGKADGAVRQHIRRCEDCKEFRKSLDASTKALAAVFPIGALAAFKAFVAGKLGIGGSSASGGAAGSALGGAAGTGGLGGGAAAGGAAAGGGALGGAIGGVAATGAGAGGIGGAIGGALGAKAAAGVATAAIVAAGAVEVKKVVSDPQPAQLPALTSEPKQAAPAARTELKGEDATIREAHASPAPSPPPADLAPANEPATTPEPEPAVEPAPPVPAEPVDEAPVHDPTAAVEPTDESNAVTETGTDPTAHPNADEETPLAEPSEPSEPSEPVLPPPDGESPQYDDGSVATPPPSSTPEGSAR